MRVKPTERKLVATILDGEHESAEAAAEAVLVALDAKRADDKLWAAIIHTSVDVGGKRVTLGRGPFGTRKRAETAAQRVVSAGPDPWYCNIVELRKGENDG